MSKIAKFAGVLGGQAQQAAGLSKGAKLRLANCQLKIKYLEQQLASMYQELGIPTLSKMEKFNLKQEISATIAKINDINTNIRAIRTGVI